MYCHNKFLKKTPSVRKKVTTSQYGIKIIVEEKVCDNIFLEMIQSHEKIKQSTNIFRGNLFLTWDLRHIW